MPDRAHFALFLAAATLLAITPGPGIFFVLARSLAGGRREGILSCLGTFAGGLVHVVAAALGISALLAASAVAFAVVKYAGAAYLIYLGVRLIQTRNQQEFGDAPPKSGDSFKQGVWTEVLNPKTALFFLAFIPQFISVQTGHIFWGFALLGSLSVALNTSADLVVATFAGALSDKLRRNARLRKRQRTASGIGMIGLGVYVAFSGNSHSK